MSRVRLEATPSPESIKLGAVSAMTMRDALCTQLHVTVFDLDPINIDQKRRVVRPTLGVQAPPRLGDQLPRPATERA